MKAERAPRRHKQQEAETMTHAFPLTVRASFLVVCLAVIVGCSTPSPFPTPHSLYSGPSQPKERLATICLAPDVSVRPGHTESFVKNRVIQVKPGDYNWHVLWFRMTFQMGNILLSASARGDMPIHVEANHRYVLTPLMSTTNSTSLNAWETLDRSKITNTNNVHYMNMFPLGQISEANVYDYYANIATQRADDVSSHCFQHSISDSKPTWSGIQSTVLYNGSPLHFTPRLMDASDDIIRGANEPSKRIWAIQYCDNAQVLRDLLTSETNPQLRAAAKKQLKRLP